MSRQLDRTETPIARKRHGCVVCLRWISPGERYVRWTGINPYTYEFDTSAFCIGCNLAWVLHYHVLGHDVEDCSYTVECLQDEAAGGSIMAAALAEGISERWWSRPDLAVVPP